jgi:leucyl-tRNA synthetase
MSTKSTAKLDFIRGIELHFQNEWDSTNVFEPNATNNSDNTYFATFPFPYMNGTPHAGHLYSLSKAEFTVGFKRMQPNTRVLFPFAFHCTGMPIKTSADKIKAFFEEFGYDGPSIKIKDADKINENNDEVKPTNDKQIRINPMI